MRARQDRLGTLLVVEDDASIAELLQLCHSQEG